MKLRRSSHMGRPLSACQRCRKLKVACCGTKPRCGRCVASATLSCDYMASSTRRSLADEISTSSSSPSTPSVGTTISSENPESPQLVELHDLSTSSSTARRRARAVLSCTRCRHHKVRCDRGFPCGRCRKIGKPNECTFTGSAEGSPVFTDLNHGRGLRAIATSYVDETWNRRFRNGTHWNKLLQEISQRLPTPPHIDEGIVCEPATQIFSSGLQMYINYPFGQDSTSAEPTERLLAELPPAHVQDDFVACYMNTVERTHHLLHRNEFHSDVRLFRQRGRRPGGDDWLAQYLMVLSLGCLAHNFVAAQNAPNDVYDGLPGRLLRGAESCLKRTPFMFRPTLATIRTLCLIVISKQIYAMSCHEADTCWPLTGLVVRLSMGMGLHVAREHDRGSSPATKRAQTRLWAAVVFLETRQTLVCGMPLQVRVDDVASLVGAAASSAAVAEDDDDPSMLESVLGSCGQLLLRAVEMATSADGMVTYEEAIEVDTAMRSCLTRLASWTAENHESENGVDLGVCMMDIFFRQILLALHSRFAIRPLASTQHPVSYVSMLESALSILSRQRSLCEGEDARASANAWVAGFFRHEFFTAAMTVCCQLVCGRDGDGDEDDLPPVSWTETQPRSIMLDALQACRDVWQREKDVSVCNANAYAVVDGLVRTLRESRDE